MFFQLFLTPKAQICFLQSLLRLHACHTLLSGSFDVEENEIFQFCDLKNNLHIRVHGFPCSKGSNLFPPIFIEISTMLYFVVGQS
jgi:hypothetical protein